MEVLWNLGAATADQVREQLPDRPHGSTVRTLLRVLVEKGFVSRDDRGTAYTYRPAEGGKARGGPKAPARPAFGGSAESLVLRLIEDEQLRPEQLEEIAGRWKEGRSPNRSRGKGDRHERD